MARPTATTDNRQVAGYAKTESISDVSCTGSSFTTTITITFESACCVSSPAPEVSNWMCCNLYPAALRTAVGPYCIVLHCIAMHCTACMPHRFGREPRILSKRPPCFITHCHPATQACCEVNRYIICLIWVYTSSWILTIVTILPAIIPPISQSIYMFTKCYYKVKHFCWTNLSLHILIIHLLHASVMFVVL